MSHGDPLMRAMPAAAHPAAEEAQRIEYFNAPSHRRPSVFPGLLIGMIGLGLIVMGGLCMLGVLYMYSGPGTRWNASSVSVLVVLLYVVAVLCFSAAVPFLLRAAKSLNRAAKGQAPRDLPASPPPLP